MQGDQGGLGQDLQNALGLQILDRGSQSVRQIEIKQIQKIADDGGVGAILRLEAGRAELLGAGGAAVLAQTEQVDAKGGQLGAIDLDHTHFQLHLRQMTRIDYQSVNDILGINASQPGSFVGRGIAVDHAAEMDAALLRLHFHPIAGQGLGQRITQPGNIHIGQHGIELGRASVAPQHQTAAAGRFGGNYDFQRIGCERIQHLRIAYIDSPQLFG